MSAARFCALAAVLAAASCAVEDRADGPDEGVVHLTAWTLGPEASAYTRKTNLVEGARRLDQDLAREGGRRITIDVDFATSNREAHEKKLVFAFASGRAPDIVCGGHELVGRFAPPGYLVPLDDFLAARPAFRDDFFPVLWEAMTWNGATYGVPQDNEVRLAYFRKDLLRRLGWSEAEVAALPERVARAELSLDWLADLGEQAVARGVVAPGSALWHRTRAGFDWLQFLIAHRGRLTDDQGHLVLSRRATLATLRLFDRLVERRVTPAGMMSYPERTVYDGFVRGRVLVYLTGGSWHKLEWENAFDFGDERFRREVSYFPIPGAAPGDPPVSVSHPFACMITRSAPDKELAFRVIERSMDADLDVHHAVSSSHLVVRRSAGLTPAYAEDPFLQDMIKLLRFTRFAPNHTKLMPLMRVLYDGIRGVEVGALSPEEALDFIVRVGGARLGDALVIEE